MAVLRNIFGQSLVMLSDIPMAPRLFSVATYMLWILGLSWPGPSMLLLGLGLIGSPLADRRLVAAGIESAWMLRLRWILSLGLGVLTLTMAAIALVSTP